MEPDVCRELFPATSQACRNTKRGRQNEISWHPNCGRSCRRDGGETVSRTVARTPFSSRLECGGSIRMCLLSLMQFDFLGYTFRPRLSRNRRGKFFVNFTPAISNKAAKAIRQKVRSWNWQLRPGNTLEDLALECNPIIQGWKFLWAIHLGGAGGEKPPITLYFSRDLILLH